MLSIITFAPGSVVWLSLSTTCPLMVCVKTFVSCENTGFEKDINPIISNKFILIIYCISMCYFVIMVSVIGDNGTVKIQCSII